MRLAPRMGAEPPVPGRDGGIAGQGRPHQGAGREEQGAIPFPHETVMPSALLGSHEGVVGGEKGWIGGGTIGIPPQVDQARCRVERPRHIDRWQVMQERWSARAQIFTSFWRLRSFSGRGWPGNRDGQEATETSPT